MAKKKARKESGGGDSENINAELSSLVRPIKTLRLAPSNVKDHSESDVAVIMESLRKFGQQKPVVALKDGTVIAGNGMLMAAKKLGWRNLAAIRFSSDDQADADGYMVTDNKTSELSRWGYESLAKILKRWTDKMDWKGLGWKDFELEPLMEANWTAPEVKDMPEGSGLSKPIKVTEAQREVFESACKKVRKSEKDTSINEGRCLELICADFLAG